jgi:HAE1 family hydrophobic/amphiphilic exporter-1
MKGPTEILMAIVASTLTTISVFVPVLFVPGIAGVMFKDMALTICVSLAASLFVAVSLVPLLGSRLLLPAGRLGSRSGSVARAGEWARGVIQRLERRYSITLKWALGHRAITVGGAVAVFAISMGMATMLGGEFIPEANQEQLRVTVERAPGTSVVEMEQTFRRLELIIQETVPEAYAVTATYGPGEGWASFSATATNQGTIEINLVPIGERERGTDEIREALLPLLEKEPGIELNFTAGGGHADLMNQPDIVVEIVGHDLDEGRRIGLDLVEKFRGMEGVVGSRPRPRSPFFHRALRQRRHQRAQHLHARDRCHLLHRGQP